MRVLVACEESQEVCKAFRALGHEAYSCDIEPCSGGKPEWHLQVDALELLCSELESAPETVEPRKRLYCFYIPFLQPELDRRFRENGVDLLGSAAFLYTTGAPGFGTGGAAAAWLSGMSIAGGLRRECRSIAEEMRRMGCCAYFTGAFAFDRWMGAPDPLRRRILAEEYGVRTLFLDSDFWCENAMFGSVLERVDNLCVQL